ncbi:hypothetical protein A1O3_09428 [Capronia epimyces CBS 606.96]|uniref:Uncharacterized protein n=1 Tax=Capronia epimyces CBS 606.96 TaxID=1182542 RepID=W9XCQ0_9EURO|nr:uncharacterized protein A1O3_09428 [Capronia epimyces CBS 606.96]EXJ78267.1 hypothetical protein A1O3_09428 [Capronia epimyces CBS 606.96]
MLFTKPALALGSAPLVLLVSAQEPVDAVHHPLIPALSKVPAVTTNLMPRSLDKRCSGSCEECFGTGYILCPDSSLYCYLPGDSYYGLDSCPGSSDSSASAGATSAASATVPAASATSISGIDDICSQTVTTVTTRTTLTTTHAPTMAAAALTRRGLHARTSTAPEVSPVGQILAITLVKGMSVVKMDIIAKVATLAQAMWANAVLLAQQIPRAPVLAAVEAEAEAQHHHLHLPRLPRPLHLVAVTVVEDWYLPSRLPRLAMGWLALLVPLAMRAPWGAAKPKLW